MIVKTSRGNAWGNRMSVDRTQRLATIRAVFGDVRTTASAKYESELRLHYIKIANVDIDMVGIEVTFQEALSPMPWAFLSHQMATFH